MYTASYLLSSTGIRFKENGRHQIRWIQDVKPARGGLKPSVIRERADQVFQLIPGRIKHLVIVNGNLSDAEMIQACVEVAEKYADNIIVIPPLLARMTYALEDIARFHNPPEKEILLVVTVTHAFVDFVILQRDNNFELNIIEKFMFKQINACVKEFPRIYEKFFPHATVLLVHDDFLQLADQIQHEFNPDNFFMRHFKRWDYLLMFGALSRAVDGDPDFDPSYHIPNFTMGIETIVPGRGTGCNYVILPERTRIPCEIYGVGGNPQPLTLFYFPEHYLFFDNLTYERKDASTKCVWTTGSPDQVIGYYDERGVPYITSTKDRRDESPFKRESDKKNGTTESATKVENPFPTQSVATSSFARRPTSITSTPAVSEVTFIFEDQYCSVEIYQDDVVKKINDSTGIEWTPLYLSMKSGKPEIGKNAKDDYKNLSNFVIYDVLKIIGRPLNEIQRDPSWGFELVPFNGTFCFQVETPNGPIQVPQEIVISAFLKAMKRRTELFMGNNELKEIRLSTNFRLTRSQKAVFEMAAEKNKLRILCFIVTDA